MYSKDFRTLALKKINEFGITKASSIMNVHRTTLWRWKRALLYKNKLKNVKRVNHLFNKLNQFIDKFIKNVVQPYIYLTMVTHATYMMIHYFPFIFIRYKKIYINNNDNEV